MSGAGVRRCNRLRRTRHQPDDTSGSASSGSPERSIDDCPTELLQTILHTCGRHTRRVSRHWRDTYGPLTCGLTLTSPTTPDDLSRLPPHLASVPTLAITAPPPTLLPRPPPAPASLTAALPRTFSALTSLDLDTKAFRTQTHETPDPIPLPPLTPLHPHLTALHLRNLPHADALASLPAALPLLRSLTCTIEWTANEPGLQALLPALTLLTTLRHLHHLSISRIHGILEPLAITPFLPHLARLPPTLTHLTFRICSLYLTHTPEDLDCLQPALPNLRSLSLAVITCSGSNPGPDPEANPCPLATLTAALSQRQALTHLDLRLDNLADEGADAPPSCQLLSLKALEVKGPGSLPAGFLRQVGAAGALTRLALHNVSSRTNSSRYLAPVTALLAGVSPTLAQLRWSQLAPDFATMACLSRLSALRSLKLESEPGRGTSFADWRKNSRRATDAITSLTALTHLHLPFGNDQLTVAVLRGLSALVHLRQLYLYPALALEDMSPLASASTTLTHLELNTFLRHNTEPLRALRQLPGSVRCLRVYTPRGTFGFCKTPNVARMDETAKARWRSKQQQLLADLLPLPAGVRVLELNCLPWLFEETRSKIAAAARRQDCVLERELPDDEHLFGCNGYRC